MRISLLIIYTQFKYLYCQCFLQKLNQIYARILSLVIWAVFGDEKIILMQKLIHNIIPKMENTEISPSPNLSKLISFLSYHEVQVKQIWGTEPGLSVILFAETLYEKFGYKVNTNELLELRKLADITQKLYAQNFHVFGLWKSCFYQEKQKKVELFRKEKQRPLTAKQLSSKLTQSKASVAQLGQKSHLCAESVLKSRIKQADEVLEKKILENALDKKWEYLIKVGQMNSWRRQIKITDKSATESEPQVKQPKLSNKIYKVEGHDQNIIIIEQKQNGQTQVLPLKVFDQKYQSMKKKLTTEEKVKNNMKGSMLLVLEKKDKVTKSKLCERISQRDQELNYVLLQIMRLKNLFEQQEHVLTECGVNM